MIRMQSYISAQIPVTSLLPTRGLADLVCPGEDDLAKPGRLVLLAPGLQLASPQGAVGAPPGPVGGGQELHAGGQGHLPQGGQQVEEHCACPGGGGASNRTRVGRNTESMQGSPIL